MAGNFVEVGRNDLIAGYVGQTALKTQKVIEKALGGVLFIDEAYSLFSDDSYSAECICTLIKAMEDHRDNLCVIMAGYPQNMEELLKSNYGFSSRIAFKIDFADYTVDELYQILTNGIKQEGFTLDKDCKTPITEYFENEVKNADDNFGNARMVRSFFERIKLEQATRIVDTKSKDINLITTADVSNVIEKIKTQKTQVKIGFSA